MLGLVLCRRERKNLQWPWEHEDGERSSHRQRSWAGDVCTGFSGEASLSPASFHTRDSWDMPAEQVSHQSGLRREFTPQHKGTEATPLHREISRTNRLPGAPSCEKLPEPKHKPAPGSGTQGERIKAPAPRTWLGTAPGLADPSLRSTPAGNDGRHPKVNDSDRKKPQRSCLYGRLLRKKKKNLRSSTYHRRVPGNEQSRWDQAGGIL